ncbi:DUF917 domain-containing protein [Pseudonocardia sp.]|uniref:DUF917 domain-containing protein n=1 Tax=Pseudonocardia sp. TaxID=60912 RepID=UPI003D0EBDF7
MRLDAENIEAFALGCAVLSAGGGGDTAIGLAMARHAIECHGPVEVVAAADLAPDALVMPCGLIGSPTVAQERIWSGDEGERLANAVARLHGARVDVLMCYEIAGANGLLPVLWAARLGTPLLDADGMGRAFPEMQQQAMHVAGVAASPVVLNDGRDNDIVLHSADNLAAERLARSCTAALGGTCAGALYVMSGRVARSAAIVGSVSRAVAVGDAMHVRRSGWPAALADETGGRVLIEGRIVEVERSGGAGFARGHAVVEGTDVQGLRRLRLELQNEVLVALEDGEVVATVPDVIAVLGLVDGRPVGTERLQYSQRVGVVAVPAPEVWRSAAGLAVVGPRSFGYDLDYAGPGAVRAGR